MSKLWTPAWIDSKSDAQDTRSPGGNEPPEDGSIGKLSRADLRSLMNTDKDRPAMQGGGKYSKVAPAVRRSRRRKANLAAKASRRRNWQ